MNYCDIFKCQDVVQLLEITNSGSFGCKEPLWIRSFCDQWIITANESVSMYGKAYSNWVDTIQSLEILRSDSYASKEHGEW